MSMKKGITFRHWLSRVSLLGVLMSASVAMAQCPTPSTLSSAATCGQGATLTASGSTGLYRWYNQPSGGSVLGTGATFSTPAMYAQATYYVEAVNSYNNPNCVSPRAALVVTVNPLAMPTITGDTVTCGGTATLSAAGSTGLYRWYSGPTGGAVLATGANFTPPGTLQSTTYYVEATNNLNPVSTVNFNYNGGQQSWTVPAGVFSIVVDMEGAEGSRTTNYGNRGGYGGKVVADVAVTPGQTIYVYVGGWPGDNNTNGGYNGGNYTNACCGYAYGGGGGTDIRIGGTGFANRVLVAGGGGGGGYLCGTDGSRGGNGGGLTGEAGYYCSSTGNTGYTGRGGSQNAGGAAGGTWCCPIAGTLGNGGYGSYRGGGGGGGYYGGGGSSRGGGGGGSSYSDPALCSNVTHTQGTRQGHGRVSITYTTPFCVSNRVPVPLTVTPLATPTANPISTTCGSNITASASGSTGWYHWFAAPTGGSPLSTQSNYAMSFVTQTDTIWVEAVSDPNPSGTQTFNYTGGNQTWTVPAGVFAVSFDVRGAQGGTNSWNDGGKGGKVTGTLAVTPGQTLNVYVGGQPGSGGCCTGVWGPGGWNGGGQGYAYFSGQEARGGGGASDIRIGGTTLNNRVVVAGGGGGAGGQYCNGNQDKGGAGGGSGNAGNGLVCNGYNSCYCGTGGTQTTGGTNGCGGQAGQFGVGGNAWAGCCGYPSGGGGGGWYGGGGGYYYGGGGGGSSYVNPNLTSNVTHTQGDQNGNGQVIISFVKTYCSSTRVPVAISVAPLAAPVTQGDSVTCGTPVTLTATSNSSVSWYDAPTGGNVVAIGPSISLPPILGSDTLYAVSELTSNLSGSQTFNFTGSAQTYTIPANVTSINVDVMGAQGGGSLPNPGNNPGGLGGRVQTTLSVTPGEVLNIYVGGSTNSNTGGWNGGGDGSSNGAGGGGASDIRIGGNTLASRVVTAGGGGGGGWNCSSGMGGGAGGGSGTAGNGNYCNNPGDACNTGKGATPTAGGQGGTCGCSNAGVLGIGGKGGGTCNYSGGGGGGGQFGGGGGRYGGGGGGSSFASPTIASNTAHTQGFRSGNGQIVISYNLTLVCASARVPAVIWLDSLPAPVASGDTTFCGSGSANLSVTGPNGNYSWYDSWGGNLAHIGQNWTTPSNTQTINYHVNYTVNGCPSKFDTALVTVNRIPYAYLTDPGILCAGNGNVDLGFEPPLLQGNMSFTNLGKTGNTGPDQAAADAAYGAGMVTVNSGVQRWTVPYTGMYTIEVAGAKGGGNLNNAGGNGAKMQGDFMLTAGTQLDIIVGQMGVDAGGNTWQGGGGGGGSFVWDASNQGQPLIVAGGGGGGGNNQSNNKKDAWTNNDGQTNGENAPGGTNGSGGGAGNTGSWGGGGGGGFLTDGASDGSYGKGGKAAINGGNGGQSGGSSYNSGGFGGGGSDGYDGGGGGGGYSGGRGGGYSGHTFRNGGGGGSFNAGANQMNQAAVNSSHGFVNISYFIAQPSDTAGVWSGTMVTDTVNGILDPLLGQVGTNMVYYTVSINGCTHQDSLSVTVVQGPDASITTASTQLCDYDNSISLAALNSGGNWTGNGLTVVGNNVSFDPGSVPAGTYQAYHSLLDTATGCLSTDSVQIVVNPTPNASLTLPSTVCSADAPFNLVPGTPGGVFTGTGVTDTVNGVFTPSLNVVGTQSITYQVTANGCFNTANTNVTVFASPDPTISNAPLQLCENASNVLLQAATVGGNWYGSGMSNAGSGLFDVQLAGTGTAQVVYVVSNANCTNSDTVNIVVNPLPVVNVTPNTIQQLCSGSNIPMSASGAITYQWTNNGSPISGANTANYTANTAGSYSVIGTDGNGCVSTTAPVQVNVLPNPVIFQVNSTSVCEGNATAFSQNSGIGQGGVITNYSWDFGDGNSGSGFSTNHIYATAGSYTAQLIVATPEGCSDTLTQNVLVKANPSVDSVMVTGACFPSPANFQAFVSGTPMGTYSWNFGNGINGSGVIAQHQYSTPGVKYYTLNALALNGCATTFNGTVTVDELPTAGFLVEEGCENTPITITDVSSGNINDWSWDYGVGTTNGQAPSISFAQAGTYPVVLTVTTPAGCSNSTTQLVTIAPSPDATYNWANQGLNLIQFAPQNPVVGATYLWNLGDGTTTSVLSPLHQYNLPGNYQVCLTMDVDGCSSTECQVIEARDITSFEGNQAAEFGLSVYPNPFQEQFFVGMMLKEATEVKATLRDLTGKQLAAYTFGVVPAGSHNLPVTTSALQLSAGVYVLEMNLNGAVYSTRIIRE